MSLGERLRLARREKGLSQKQLCGDTVTRNMLSLIENGNAQPSMATLCTLAARLEKPVSWFLEEETPSKNQGIVRKARQAPAEEVLTILKEYRGPDDVFDAERYLLEALACLRVAEHALADGRNDYARHLLLQGQGAGTHTPYFTEDLKRRFCLMRYACDPAGADALEQQLPDLQPELMLRASNAAARGDYALAGALLDSCGTHGTDWCLLRGKVYIALEEFEPAAHLLERLDSPRAYGLLEECYRGLEDYKRAYEYACKQRQFTENPAH